MPQGWNVFYGRGDTVMFSRKDDETRDKDRKKFLPYIILVISAVMSVYFLTAAFDALSLRANSEEVEGKVVRTSITGLGRSTEEYHVAFSYSVDGSDYENSSTVEREQFNSVVKGDSVKVFYDSKDPENSRPFEKFDVHTGLVRNGILSAISLFFFGGSAVTVISRIKKGASR